MPTSQPRLARPELQQKQEQGAESAPRLDSCAQVFPNLAPVVPAQQQGQQRVLLRFRSSGRPPTILPWSKLRAMLTPQVRLATPARPPACPLACLPAR